MYYRYVTVQYSQLRAKIHSKSAVPIGFLPYSLSFLTVSAVNAQTHLNSYQLSSTLNKEVG